MLDYESIFDGDLKPGENVKNLYVGRFDEKPGIIVTDNGEFPTLWWGEILIYTDGDENNATIQQLRRLAMYGQLQNPDDDPRIGVISLSSILPPEEAPAYEQSISDIQLQLHYAALTDIDLPDVAELDDDESLDIPESDPVFPRVEQITASFSWQVENIDPQKFTLWVENLMTGDMIDPVLEVVKRVSLASLNINFFLAGTAGPPPEPSYSLPSNCPPGPFDCPTGFFDVLRFLPVRFVNASSASLQDDNVQNSGKSLEALCLDQIDRVCEVWRNKSCLDLYIPLDIIPGNPNFALCTPVKEVTIKNSGFAIVDAIEIYLVNQLVRWANGGITHNANQASAYCILGINKMIENPYLLAHELCHVLGLSHPNAGGLVDGDLNTIAQPGNQNPPNQSWNNLQIFIDPAFPLNPLVRTTAIPDCFRP